MARFDISSCCNYSQQSSEMIKGEKCDVTPRGTYGLRTSIKSLIGAWDSSNVGGADAAALFESLMPFMWF